mgnify:CR=1 FL=1
MFEGKPGIVWQITSSTRIPRTEKSHVCKYIKIMEESYVLQVGRSKVLSLDEKAL